MNDDGNLIHSDEWLEIVASAARAAARVSGKGDKHLADEVAVKAFNDGLEKLSEAVVVAVGEGERDFAPRLNQSKVYGGSGHTREANFEIAIDPLECTKSCAEGLPNSFVVLAVGRRGAFLPLPDIFVHKLACGPALAGRLNLGDSIEKNLLVAQQTLGCPASELTVIVLKRDYNQPLGDAITAAGAKVRWIQDGDVLASLQTCLEPKTLLAGIGGATEGVLSSAALQCLGGDLQVKVYMRNDHDQRKLQSAPQIDPNRIYQIHELASGSVSFWMAGVTAGDLLPGVLESPSGVEVTILKLTTAKMGVQTRIAVQQPLLT